MTRHLGEKIAGGTRSTVYAWGRDAVVKVPHHDTPDEWIGYEALYVAAVHAVGAPVPRMLGIEQVGGRPASVFERLHGPSMWAEVVAEPGRAAHHAGVLASLQNDLFELVPPVSIPSQRDRLASKIRTAATTVEPSTATALSWLDPPARPGRLCHGDLHPDNVILTARGPMVIDWFDASRGDPLADIARTLVLLGDGQSMRTLPRHLPGATVELVRAFLGAYREHMSARRPLDDDMIARWQAIEVAARLSEGVAREGLLDAWAGLCARLGAVA
jgi:aminoglycoside phosphotransferase (APT) family kinase protein